MLLCFLLAIRPMPARAEKERTVHLPILMYHQLSENRARRSRYVITPDDFESDLVLLRQRGYETISVRDLNAYARGKKRLPEKPILLTFDDGFESDYVYAFPLLKQYEAKAVFNIIGKYADLYSGDVTKHISYSHLNWEQIREMGTSGLAEIQHHGYDLHDNSKRRGALRRANESEQTYEKMIAEDFKRLNDKLADNAGTVAVAFACPFGNYNDALKQALERAGCAVIFTSAERVNILTGNPEELYRLGRFVRSSDMNLATMLDAWEREKQ